MLRIENKNMYLNRGDAIALTINCNETFSANDVIKFTICKKGDYSSIIYQKEFTVIEESSAVTIELTSEETRLGNPLKNAPMTYWYEIELNGNTTLIGFDENGAKEFVLYPEATEV